MDTDTNPEEQVDVPETSEERRGLPRWKMLLIVGAGALVVIGAILIPFEGGSAPENLSSGGGGTGAIPDGAAGFAAGGTNIPGTDTPSADGSQTGDGEGTLSPAFMKLGFSFFAGFAIGWAFRAFLRLALIFVGLQLLALLGLEYVEWIQVNWQTVEGSFDHFMEAVKREAESFKTFITGRLPQAGLAGLGLFTGFKRS